MKKVVYSVTRYRTDDNDKISGLGYITDNDLVITCISKVGKPYIHMFEGCVEISAHIRHMNEFKGALYNQTILIRSFEIPNEL